MSRMEDSGMTQQGGEVGQGQGGGAQMRDTAQQVQENLRNLGSQVRDQATQQYG